MASAVVLLNEGSLGEDKGSSVRGEESMFGDDGERSSSWTSAGLNRRTLSNKAALTMLGFGLGLGHVGDKQEDKAEYLLGVALHHVYTESMQSTKININTVWRDANDARVKVALHEIDAHANVVHLLALEARVTHIARNAEPKCIIR